MKHPALHANLYLGDAVSAVSVWSTAEIIILIYGMIISALIRQYADGLARQQNAGIILASAGMFEGLLIAVRDVPESFIQTNKIGTGSYSFKKYKWVEVPDNSGQKTINPVVVMNVSSRWCWEIKRTYSLSEFWSIYS